MNDHLNAKMYKKLTLFKIGLLLTTGLLMFGFFTLIVSPRRVLAQGPTANSDNCIACHTNPEKMQALAQENEITSDLTSGEGHSGQLPQVEVWQKYFIPDLEAVGAVHNIVGCTTCHGGTGDTDNKDEAHTGLFESASKAPEETCGICHREIAGLNEKNLHVNLGGFDTILTTRGADFDNPDMGHAFEDHCVECHADCGQCHVSRPAYAGGGLIAGHEFERIVPENIACDGCHGGRISPEYKGENKGVPGDVHWEQEGMSCIECHPVKEMHGDGNDYDYRYDSVISCSSADCHPNSDAFSDVEQHSIHGDKVACQVCHSGEYKNCANCHTGTDDKGLPYYTLDPSWLDFKIGRNPNPGQDRPWVYELVRHIPVIPDTFADYGDDLLSNFDALPTWKRTTPHNIQKVTPQNQACENCHQNPELFLTEEDVTPAELTANTNVIVAELPKMAGAIGEVEASTMLHPLEGYESCASCHVTGQIKTIPHPLENHQDCFFCHREGVGAAPKFSGGHNDFSIDNCLECHPLADLNDPASAKAAAEIPSLTDVRQEPERKPLLSEAEIVGVECYECHEAEVLDWSQTTHAIGTKTEGFLQIWETENRSGECLRCHTSGYNEITGEFAFEGIGCEACHAGHVEGHGQVVENGCASPTMPIPVDCSVCATCHEFTYSEWQISGHAKSNVSCISCHLAHVQGTRLPADELCGACHQDRLDDYAHTSHYDQDVSCIDCHMHAPDPDSNQVMGTGAVGHNFFVGTETCARCHEETVHVKREVILEEVDGTDRLMSLIAKDELAGLKQQVKTLQENVVSVLGVGLGVGGFLGVAGLLIVTRSPGRKQKKTIKEKRT